MNNELFTVFKYAFFNIVRAKWILIYSFIFAIFAFSVLKFANDPSKVAASLLNIVLLIVPMVSVLYGSVYWYNSDSFIRLLLTQPVRRASVLVATWFAISIALASGFVFGVLAPALLISPLEGSTILIVFIGTLLTFIFVALGILIAILSSDRMVGVGLAFVFWMYFAILHDAMVFVLISALHDYPIEIPAMILMALNPIDLGRVSLLLAIDLSAMMGYTGRILQRILSSSMGVAFCGGILVLWLSIPAALAAWKFKTKDL